MLYELEDLGMPVAGRLAARWKRRASEQRLVRGVLLRL
jgi:hypothetical protein